MEYTIECIYTNLTDKGIVKLTTKQFNNFMANCEDVTPDGRLRFSKKGEIYLLTIKYKKIAPSMYSVFLPEFQHFC